MAGITLAQAEAQLSAWIAASTAIASGQSYSIAGRSLTRANLADVLEQIKFWDNLTKQLTPRGRGRTRYPVNSHE
jgi:uncharacterized protein DUF6148